MLVQTVKSIKEIGFSQYKDYVQNVIITKKISIHQPIKKNSLPLFKRQRVKENKVKKKINNLKSDVCLFSHLYNIQYNSRRFR